MPHMSQREIIPTHRGEDNAKTGGSVWCSYKPRNIDSYPKPEESRKRFPPEPPEGARPWQCLDLFWVNLTFNVWPAELERINFCCMKPPILCKFVTAAAGNEYTTLHTFVKCIENLSNQSCKKQTSFNLYRFFGPFSTLLTCQKAEKGC